jgi:MFS family permease
VKLTKDRKYGYPKLSPLGVTNLTANIVSTLQAGCFFGCLLAIWGCDKLGRRTTLIIAGLITIVGCIMQAAGNGHLPVLYVGRYVNDCI